MIRVLRPSFGELFSRGTYNFFPLFNTQTNVTVLNPSLGKGDEQQRYRSGDLHFIRREGVGGKIAIEELHQERTSISPSQNLQCVKAGVTEAKHGASNGSDECIELEEIASDNICELIDWRGRVCERKRCNWL
jgi:hypothetical protein